MLNRARRNCILYNNIYMVLSFLCINRIILPSPKFFFVSRKGQDMEDSIPGNASYGFIPLIKINN